ncbi:MAG TPA: hypothetical protein VFB13_10080 [Reyranella sp.]|jgi:hypothetical protein|nr:hypothetical protein [Reyranella sp.]
MTAESLQAQAKRQAAARARRLALDLFGEDRARALEFALELEAEADALEQGADRQHHALDQSSPGQSSQDPDKPKA